MSKKEVSTPATARTTKENLTAKPTNAPVESKSALSQQNLQQNKVKAENILAQSGLLEAYEYVQKQFIKHGFPTGNVFEQTAELVQKYDKKIKHRLELKKQEALRAAKELDQGSPSGGDKKVFEESKKDTPALGKNAVDPKKQLVDPKKVIKEEPAKESKDKKEQSGDSKKEPPKDVKSPPPAATKK